MELPERFKLMRLQARHTQSSLANASGLSRSAISTIEINGRPNTETLAVALRAIDKKMEDIYENKVPPKQRDSEHKDTFDKVAELLDPQSGRAERTRDTIDDLYRGYIKELEEKIGIPAGKPSKKAKAE